MTRLRLMADATGVVHPALDLPDRRRLDQDRPDESWAIESPDGVVAACSVWWTDTAALDGEPTGYVGHFTAIDEAAGAALLRHAAERLATVGCRRVVGPIDGSTWRRYRAVTDGLSRPPFLLEPVTPDWWPDMFRAAGFDIVATYRSSITATLDRDDPKADRHAEALPDRGIRIRAFDPQRAQDDLLRLHELVLESFQGNFLYTPLDAPSFVAQYEPILPLIRPDYFLFAEEGGDAVAFAFAYPDHAQARRGEPVDTLVLKTVGIRPGRAYMGLGRILANEVQRRGLRDGYRTAIHALMHEGNRSAAWSRREGGVLRRYALFGRTLP